MNRRAKDPNAPSGFCLSTAARTVLDRISAFFAVFLIIYLGVLFLNMFLGLSGRAFIPDGNALNMMYFIRDIAIMTVVGLSGLSFFFGRQRRKLLFFLIYLAVLAAAVILMVMYHISFMAG